MQEFNAVYICKNKNLTFGWNHSTGCFVKVVEEGTEEFILQNKDPETYLKLQQEAQQGTFGVASVLFNDGNYQFVALASNMSDLLHPTTENKTPLNKEEFLDTIAEFSWDFHQTFFVETEYGNFIWSDPSYGGDNTLRGFNGTHTMWLNEINLDCSRCKGNHRLGRYCGSDVDIVPHPLWNYTLVDNSTK